MRQPDCRPLFSSCAYETLQPVTYLLYNNSYFRKELSLALYILNGYSNLIIHPYVPKVDYFINILHVRFYKL